MSKHFKMYITIDDIKCEKRIDLSYPIHSLNTRKEITVISPFSDNIQYEIINLVQTSIIFHGIKKLILNRTYTGKELLSVLEGMVVFDQSVNDDRVIKTNKLSEITEMIINLNELDNSDNLEDGRPSNSLLTYHVTSDEDFTCFEPHPTVQET